MLRGGTQDQYGKQKSWQDLLPGSVGGTAAFNLPGGSMKRKAPPYPSFCIPGCYQCSEALEPTSSCLHPSRAAGLALAKAIPEPQLFSVLVFC